MLKTVQVQRPQEKVETKKVHSVINEIEAANAPKFLVDEIDKTYKSLGYSE